MEAIHFITDITEALHHLTQHDPQPAPTVEAVKNKIITEFVAANPTLIVVPKESTVASPSKFFGFLTSIGKFVEKGFGFVTTYAPAGAALAAAIYPPSVAVDKQVIAATELAKNTVMLVEQKYAASGAATGTGEQKVAEVLSIASPVLTSALTTAGVKGVDTPYVQGLISAIVAVLNVHPPVTGTPTADPSVVSLK